PWSTRRADAGLDFHLRRQAMAMIAHCRAKVLVSLVAIILVSCASYDVTVSAHAGPTDGTHRSAGTAANEVPESIGYGFVRSFGEPIVSPIQFSRPTDVALDSFGNIYVVDSGHRQIRKFGPDGTQLTKFGEAGQGPGQFSVTGAIAIDVTGN